MLGKYLIERCSWILFILFVLFFMCFVALIDQSIPFSSVAYIIFLVFLMLIGFIALRYLKEVPFYKKLEEWESSTDIHQLAKPERPFEAIVEHSIRRQTNHLKQEATYNQQLLELEKDQLLAWIHEVKTPLTAMHLIIERMEDKAVQRDLTFEWLRIHLLLDQQLHQKRLPFMENDLYIEQVNLHQLIFSEIKTLQSWCIQKGIGFDIELETAEAVVSDAKWLGFILRQLLTNAVKYSDSSDIEIVSSLKYEQVQLSITDHGRGIDARDLPRIFEMGFTSTAQHHDHAASGMGLYLAKKAAQSLFIHIEVFSQPGKGTTFTLTFPKQNAFSHIMGM